MVLTRATGETTYSTIGLTDPTTVQFDNYAYFFHPAPLMPIKLSADTETRGYRTLPSVHVSYPSDPSPTIDNYMTCSREPNGQSATVFIITDTSTNDWYDFDSTLGYNEGYDIEQDYSDVPFPKWMSFTYLAAGTKGMRLATNALYFEDKVDRLSGDEVFPAYDLTCRDTTKFVRYAPNRPASSRLAKKLFCGNINRVTQYNRVAFCTVVD